MAQLMTVSLALALAACGHSGSREQYVDARPSANDGPVTDSAIDAAAPDAHTDASGQCHPGEFDPSFGGAGFLTLHLGQFSLGSAIKVDSAGRIVVGGSRTNARDGHSVCLISRWLPSGISDASFGINGIVEMDLPGRHCWLSDIAVDVNGGIVGVGGLDGATAEVLLMRVDDAGNLDPAFGVSGMVENTPAVYGHAVALSTDSLQRLVVAVQQWDGLDPGAATHFRVLRYLSSGTLDASFAPNDETDTAFRSGHDLAFDVDIQPSGKIVAVGKTEPGQQILFAAARYNDDGTLDSSFGSSGTSTVDVSGAAEGVAIDSSQNIVLAGEVNSQAGICGGIARLTPDGASDLTFGGNATTSVCGGNGLTLQRIALSPLDGNLVAAGSMSLTNPGGTRLVVARLTNGGVLDSTFASSGLVQWSGTATDANAGDVAVQTDGRIVVTGSIGNDMTFDLLVARLCP